MKVVIVHYHLGLGGVSQCIRSTSSFLSEQRIPHIILCGIPPDDPGGAPVVVLPGLHYRDRCPVASTMTGESLARGLRDAAVHHLGGSPDVWHFHNHSLGKNPALCQAVALLAQSGERLLLHIHDLAEDGRPGMYANIRPLTGLYPVGPRIHYGFLNPRDLDHFRKSGLPDDRGSLLAPTYRHRERSPAGPPPSSSPPLLFAPIRGIRRKNLGELALLSVLLAPPARVAVSRAPADPESRRIHDTWKAFAADHAPRIQFDVTDRIAPSPDASTDFAAWISHSTHFIGTSIAEGLGLPFLEARMWQRPFVGRRLAYLRHMVSPFSTYDRLLIPREWIGGNRLREELGTFLLRDDRIRGAHPRMPFFERILAGLDHRDWLDFGNLPESLQQGVIERCADPASRDQPVVETDGGVLQPAVPWLAGQIGQRDPNDPSDMPPSDHIPVYEKLLHAPKGGISFLPPLEILHRYHTPESFHFLLAPPTPTVTPNCRYKVVLFDIYGTLLKTPQGPVRPDPAKDARIARTIRQLGFLAPENPTSTLYDAIRSHNEKAATAFSEVDLRKIWADLLDADPSDLDRLVIATEDIRSPALPIPGALDTIRRLAQAGTRLGIISNAQCNALHGLHEVNQLFDPSLTLLSYRLGIAKPSPEIFQSMDRRLRDLGISPREVLSVGNSLDHDILPARSMGWDTAWFTNEPSTDATFCFANYPALCAQLFG